MIPASYTRVSQCSNGDRYFTLFRFAGCTIIALPRVLKVNLDSAFPALYDKYCWYTSTLQDASFLRSHLFNSNLCTPRPIAAILIRTVLLPRQVKFSAGLQDELISIKAVKEYVTCFLLPLGCTHVLLPRHQVLNFHSRAHAFHSTALS
jgi:hypothetical protein